MEKRTLAIIAICKDRTRYTKGYTDIDGLKHYFSESSCTNYDFWNKNRIKVEMKKALYDFLDVCDKPSYYLEQMDRQMSGLDLTNPLSYIGAVINVFLLSDVKDNGEYINGFDERFEDIIKELE